MRTTVTVDPAGRIVLPKAIREGLRVGPGDSLDIESENDRLVLRPVRLRPGLQKEQGVWVYRSGTPANVPIEELLETQREKRSRHLLGERP